MPPIAARPIRVARRSRLSLLHRVTTRSASRLGGCVSSRSVRFCWDLVTSQSSTMAMQSISTIESRGSLLTSTVTRAGGLSANRFA